ncbi:hypothetical protein [Streptomyces chilikensis]|uniref:Uncharacterized protein n=1 Tax=Streptomyces chilikensis TaxID=1194079 RepID=A0ABV3EKB2_9ACTN
MSSVREPESVVPSSSIALSAAWTKPAAGRFQAFGVVHREDPR